MTERKKKEVVLIQGEDVTPMEEAQLKELHEKISEQLNDLKNDEFMERLETEMIKKALQSAQERLEKIEQENETLRGESEKRKEAEGWIQGKTFEDKVKKISPVCFKMIQNNKLLRIEESKIPTTDIEPEFSELEEIEAEEEEIEEESQDVLEEEFDIKKVEFDEEIKGEFEEESEESSIKRKIQPHLSLDRRERLRQCGIEFKSLKLNTNPDDPQFCKSVQEEKIDDVTVLKQEIKLYEFELSKSCEEMEKVFKSRLKHFNKLWSEEIRDKLLKKIERAELRKTIAYDKIEEHLKWTENKREEDKKKLKIKLMNLDLARTKMMEDRHKRKEEYLADKFHMEKMMITESYDTVIKQLKENHNVLYVNTQQFFRDTAENDILLIISLKNELKSLQENMDKMDEEIGRMKEGIKKLKGPLEESEKETRWMETFVAAISKDTKSMACHKKYNEELQKTIDSIQEECFSLEDDIKTKEQNYVATNLLKENVTEWGAKYKDSNAFVALMRDAFKSDAKKIEKMEKTLITKGLILPKHIPLIRNLVQTKVDAAKKIQFERQKEVKAFNELIHQLEIRSANLLVDSWPKVHRIGGIPYRKTPANLLATYDTSESYRKKSDSPHLGDLLIVKKLRNSKDKS